MLQTYICIYIVCLLNCLLSSLPLYKCNLHMGAACLRLQLLPTRPSDWFCDMNLSRCHDGPDVGHNNKCVIIILNIWSDLIVVVVVMVVGSLLCILLLVHLFNGIFPTRDPVAAIILMSWRGRHYRAGNWNGPIRKKKKEMEPAVSPSHSPLHMPAPDLTRNRSLYVPWIYLALRNVTTTSI